MKKQHKQPTKVYIYGRHALEEALRDAPHALLKVYFERGEIDKALLRSIEAAHIPTAKLHEGISRADLRRGSAHQGIIGQISLAALIAPYQEFLDALQPAPDTSLVLLCGVEDPHNTGALIRSAAGFGASGVLMPERNQAPVSATVINVSSGMAFRLPLTVVPGVAEAIRDLKKKGFRAYALSGEGTPVEKEAFAQPALFVLGNEGKGIPADIRAACDETLSIPMHPRCESLNVAAAGAVALYAWSAKHPAALKVR